MKAQDFHELRRLAQRNARARLQSCSGKMRYATRAEAERTASYTHRRRVSFYLCRFCGAWHKGSIIGERMRRRHARP